MGWGGNQRDAEQRRDSAVRAAERDLDAARRAPWSRSSAANIKAAERALEQAKKTK